MVFHVRISGENSVRDSESGLESDSEPALELDLGSDSGVMEEPHLSAYNKSYVTQNSAEYFAESVKEFTLDPAALKSARPKTYEAVKEAMDKLTDDRVAKVKKVYSMIWK